MLSTKIKGGGGKYKPRNNVWCARGKALHGPPGQFFWLIPQDIRV